MSDIENMRCELTSLRIQNRNLRMAACKYQNNAAEDVQNDLLKVTYESKQLAAKVNQLQKEKHEESELRDMLQGDEEFRRIFEAHKATVAAAKLRREEELKIPNEITSEPIKQEVEEQEQQLQPKQSAVAGSPKSESGDMLLSTIRSDDRLSQGSITTDISVPPHSEYRAKDVTAERLEKKANRELYANALRSCLLAQTAYAAPTGSLFWEKLNAAIKKLRFELSSASGTQRTVQPQSVSVLVKEYFDSYSKEMARMFDFLNSIEDCMGESWSVVGHSDGSLHHLTSILTAFQYEQNLLIAEAFGKSTFQLSRVDLMPKLDLQSLDLTCPFADHVTVNIETKQIHNRDKSNQFSPRNKTIENTCDVTMEGLRILWTSYCYSEVCEKSTIPFRESSEIRNGIKILLTAGELTGTRIRDEGRKLLKEVTTKSDGEVRYDPKLPPGWVLAVNDSNKRQLSICVAGTQNINDVYRDTMCKPVPITIPKTGGIICPGIKCHQGFHDGAIQLFNKIHPFIVKYASLIEASPSKPLELLFTGHSLGGAVVVLLSVFYSYLSFSGIKVSCLYTFGAPKVFVSEGYHPADVPELGKFITQQFVTDYDIVPRGLGSSKIARLTSIANRLGLSCAKFLTEDVVKHLIHYRPTTAVTYLLPSVEIVTKKNKIIKKISIKAIKGKELMDALSFNISYLKPRGFSTHRIQVYLERLQAAASNTKMKYPIRLGEYPFGVKERVLTESETVHAEMSFLKDTQRSAYEEVQRILKNISDPNIDPEAAEIIAWKEYDKLMSLKQQTSEPLQLYQTMKPLLNLKSLDLVFKIAKNEVMESPQNWKGIQLLHTVTILSFPESISVDYDLYKVDRLNNLFKTIEHQQLSPSSSLQNVVKKYPHTLLLWAVSFFQCRTGVKVFLPTAAVAVVENKFKSTAAVIVQRHARVKLSKLVRRSQFSDDAKRMIGLQLLERNRQLAETEAAITIQKLIRRWQSRELFRIVTEQSQSVSWESDYSERAAFLRQQEEATISLQTTYRNFKSSKLERILSEQRRLLDHQVCDYTLSSFVFFKLF